MTQIGYPLAQSQITTPQQWSNMALNWLGTGVIKGKLNELQVYADSTGMQVKVKTGQAFLQGHFFQSDAEEILAIANADSTNPRIDRVIVRIDWTVDAIQLAVLQGVPAVNPTAPAFTQNTSRWEISLAQVYVAKGVATIVSGNITDERQFVQNANAMQAQMSKITSDSGGYKIGLTASTDDLLAEVVVAGTGFSTIYAGMGVQNLPPSNISIRGISFLSSSTYGFIWVTDYKNNIFVNYLSNGTWTGWQELGRKPLVMQCSFPSSQAVYLQETFTFPHAYDSPPTVLAGDYVQTVSYIDSAVCFITNVTATSFVAKLISTSWTGGTQENFGPGTAIRNFTVIEK